MVPMNTMLYFCVSVIPNQSKDNGIQLMEGSGRKMEMMGSKTAQKRRDVPNTIPNGMDTATAIKKPIMTRLVEASTLAHNVPLENVWIPLLSTSEGAGRKIGSTRLNRQDRKSTRLNSSHVA